MRPMVGISVMLVLSACGSDTVSSNTAKASAANASAREAAQAGRINNPEALACVQANASDGEWAIISAQDSNAEVTLQRVLNREGTIRCFNQNNVVIYL